MLKAAARFLDALFQRGAPPEIDWNRFRVMQLIQGTAGASGDVREQLVGRGLVEIAKAPLTDGAKERAVASLRSLLEVLLPRGFRVVEGYQNPMVEALRRGPAPGTPPNVARFLAMLAELAGEAEAVTIAGQDDVAGRKLMTLLFVDGKYCGFLPGAPPG